MAAHYSQDIFYWIRCPNMICLPSPYNHCYLKISLYFNFFEYSKYFEQGELAWFLVCIKTRPSPGTMQMSILFYFQHIFDWNRRPIVSWSTSLAVSQGFWNDISSLGWPRNYWTSISIENVLKIACCPITHIILFI